MFDLITNTSLITPPDERTLASYPYLYYGIDPNKPIAESLVPLNEWKKKYVTGRFDREDGFLRHDIAHTIFGEIGLIPYDDFKITEKLVEDFKTLNAPNMITTDVRSLLELSRYEDPTALPRFLAGYLSNSNKIPFLSKILNGLHHEQGEELYVIAENLLSVYSELAEPICFYYECMDIDADLLSGIRSCLNELRAKNEVIIRDISLRRPEELIVDEYDVDIPAQKGLEEYESKKRTAIDAWKGITKTINQFKINNPEFNERVLKYSVRNMTVLFEMPADFIANYFDISLEQVNQYISEDSFCQRLPQIKLTLESLDPERFKEFKEGSY